MKLIDLNDPTGKFGLGLEREMTFAEHLQGKSFFGKAGWHLVRFLVNRIGFMPALAFEKEDVDAKVVNELLKHPELIDAVKTWIEDTDYALHPKLREAKKIFERIQRPKKRGPHLYRGFDFTTGQQHHGLADTIKTLKPGDKFTDSPEKMTSFSSYQEVTKAYGKIIVSVDYAKEDKRMFHITNEIVIATFMRMDEATDFETWFPEKGNERTWSYFESVFLPDGKPLEFTLVHK